MRLLVLALIPSLSLAAGGINKLLDNQAVQDFEPIKVKRTVLNLDDPFLVQIYGALREKGVKDGQLLNGFDLLYQKKYKESLKAIDEFNHLDYVRTTQVYLFVKLGMYQSAVNSWLNLAARPGFLNTQLAVALNQVIGKNASKQFVKYGVFLNKDQQKFLQETESNDIQFHDSLRGLAFLREGEKTLEMIPFLGTKDPLRLKLADSLVLNYAKKGELANAAKVLKGVFQPVLSKSSDIEGLSFYHLTLARLLYQAQAFDAAWEYYKVIPDESRWFLTAQVESMWISMQRSDFGQIKGQLQTLDLPAFSNEFLPERHLVSAMAHLQTCQFEKVKKSFTSFLNENLIHAKKIATALNEKVIPAADKNNFILKMLERGQQNLSQEMSTLKDLKLRPQHAALIEQEILDVKEQRNIESRRQWENRRKVLETAIYHMRFVKVEYLSTMRRLSNRLSLMQEKSDKVSFKAAGISKQERVVFPFDGRFFADELFNITSAVSDLCLKERRK